MTTIATTHGVYNGRAVDSIVRREYGRKAYVKWSVDENSPEAGLIVIDMPAGGASWTARVEAKLLWVSE